MTNSSGWARAGRIAKLAYVGKSGWNPAWRVTQAVVMGLLTIGLVGAPFSSPETTPSGGVALDESPRSSQPPVPEVVPTTPAATRTTAPAATPRPSTASPKPAAAAPSPTPARTSSSPKPPPKPKPKPSTAAAKPSTCGAPANPWGYNHCGRGEYISDPPGEFCSYFPCIASFWESTNGYVMRCEDGTYSHSGGRSGSCSHHDGNDKPLYG